MVENLPPLPVFKRYAAGSRYIALRETAKIYCSTSASLDKVITCWQHWRESHNWIYELEMCLLNIDQRNFSKIRFLQIIYRKMLIIIHEKKNRIKTVCLFFQITIIYWVPMPDTVLDAEDPAGNNGYLKE